MNPQAQISETQQLVQQITPINPSTPPGEILSYKPAGAWARFWASVIDGMVLVAPAILVAAIFYLFKGKQISFSDLTTTNEFGWTLLVLYFPYYIYTTATKGATIGKDAYGLSVVRNETNIRISFMQSFLRELIKFGLIVVPVIGNIYYFLNGLIILFTKRGIHDRITKTQVIHAQAPWSIKKQLFSLFGYLAIALLFYFVWMKINRF